MDRRITFEYKSDYAGGGEDSSHSWWAEVEYLDDRIGLCPSGFKEYVGLPDHVTFFDAVFTDIKPRLVDSFEIIQNEETGAYTLDSEGVIEWYAGVGEFLRGMAEDGYNWLHVEFTP